jgi:hypothetical protein
VDYIGDAPLPTIEDIRLVKPERGTVTDLYGKNSTLLLALAAADADLDNAKDDLNRVLAV